MIIVAVFAGLFVKTMIIDKIPEFKAYFIADTKELINELSTWKFLAIGLLAIYPITICIVPKISRLMARIRERRSRRKLIIWEFKIFIHPTLTTNLEEFNIEKINQFIEEINEKIKLSDEIKQLSHFKASLSIKLKEAQLRLKQLEHEEKLDKIKKHREIIDQQVEILQEKKDALEREKDQEITDICISLEAHDIHVFLKEDLEEHEINALLKSDFISTTEYCVFEKKLINVLLKPTMKHSSTHTFLVWSVGRLLESLPKVSHIVEHDTRDADITFRCKKETYSLEVETGTILAKMHQLRAKVSYLNRKYPGRWMFIVSNKTLASKYAKFGPTSQRKDVEKKLQKMLKLAT